MVVEASLPLPNGVNSNGIGINTNTEPASENSKPALESLAADLEKIATFNDLNNDVNEMDMIAFKVFTPTFEKSDFVIGLVESVIGKERDDQKDYDLSLIIMGKHILISLKS